MDTYELIGWIGALSFIIAYFLLVTGFLSANKPLYHLLNALGGIALTINAIHLLDIPTVVVNLVWALIALFGIWKLSTNSAKGLKKSSRTMSDNSEL